MATHALPRLDPRLLTGARAVAALWGGLALAAGAQAWALGRLGDGSGLPLAGALLATLPEVTLFALGAPLIHAAGRRFPLRPGRRARNALLHAALWGAFFLALNALLRLPGPGAGLDPAALGRGALGGLLAHGHAAALAYALVLAFAHRTAAPAAAPARVPALGRLPVETGGRVRLVPVEAIGWIEADGDHVRLRADEGTLRVRATLKALEARLDPARFARIHRSTIVNVDRVHELHHFSHGDYEVVLVDGTRLKLSRSYRERVLTALDARR